MKKKCDVSMPFLSESGAVLLVTTFMLVLWGTVHFSFQQLLIGKSTGEFNTARARKHLENITRVGPRPVGSPENEVLTVNYLLEQISHIQNQTSSRHHTISVDVQRPTGSFNLYGIIRYYNHVTNVVVKLEPEGGAQHIMLANCHFDSVPNSPGASDDAVSCAVMLEVLRSLANLSSPLKHGVVFLFNGAEENGLQASHGFITQHPWAKQVRAFVNLEARGSGGKELVFQTGPENPWLIQSYSHAVKHPFASVVGQEIFQSGLIPSNTDFYIFSHFGNVPGIDLAFIENGFIYHTKYDTPDRIPNDSIQRAGENILAILKHLAMSETLAESSEYRHGNMVFFDLLGLGMVTYPDWAGTIINCIFIVLTILYLPIKCYWTRNLGPWYLLKLFCAVIWVVFSWIVTILAVAMVAWLITLMGRTMFWYTHFYASICLYGSAAIGMMILTHTLIRNRCSKNQQCGQRPARDNEEEGYEMNRTEAFLEEDVTSLQAEEEMPCTEGTRQTTESHKNVRRLELGELFFDASLVLWCLVLVCMTGSGLCSAYVPMLMVALPLITRALLTKEFNQRGATLKYAALFSLGLALPYVHFMCLIRLVLEVFTPILGNNKYWIPTDVLMAILVTIATVFLSSFFIHFIYLVRHTKRILAVLAIVFTVMFVLVSSGLFFPFSADQVSPRPKHMSIQHITYTFHDPDGSVLKEHSQLRIMSSDYTGMDHITPLIPEINDTIRINDEWRLPAPKVSPKSPLKFQLLSKQETKQGTVNMTFEAKGPSHMTLYLQPHLGATLTSWSFGKEIPQVKSNGLCYITYSHGRDAPAWIFWFEIQLSKSPDPFGTHRMISVHILSQYVFGEDQKTPALDSMLQRVPDWAFVSFGVITYHKYQY